MSESILELIEKNLDDFYVKCTNHPNFKSSVKKEISWILSKKADWPDCIFKVNFEGLDLDNEINQIKKQITKKKLPNAWTIGPLSKPGNLEQLIKLEFPYEHHQAGMALDLKNFNNLEQDDSKIKVILIEDRTLLKEWVKIVSNVFHLRVDISLIRYLFNEAESKFFLTNYQGEYVAALLLYLSSNVAGLHAVSTLESFRGKGIALTMSRAALIHAQKLGFQKAVLQASSMGQYVYRNLGFKKYCDIFSYGLDL